MGKKGRRVRSDAAVAIETIAWVQTEPDVNGTYFVSLQIDEDEDHSYGFTRENALQYAAYVHEAAARADYDASVIKQLLSIELDQFVAIKFIEELRKDRPPLDDKWPLILEPGVAHRTGEGFLIVKNGWEADKTGEPFGQWTPGAARSHAAHVLEALAVADLDAGYLRQLIGVIGIEKDLARNMVNDLGAHR
jgi:hypothetical protein